MNVKNELESKLQEDKSYQIFSSLMDAVFDLADQLNNRSKLTKVEEKFLEAMDDYCEDACQDEE